MALLVFHLLILLLLLHHLFSHPPSFPSPAASTIDFSTRPPPTNSTNQPLHPRPRRAPCRKKQGSQKDARRRGALWLINTRRLVRERTVTHVHGVGRSLSLSFPFRFGPRFSTLLVFVVGLLSLSPSNPRFVSLSASSLFFLPRVPPVFPDLPSLSAPPLSLIPCLSPSPSVSPSPCPFSLVISSSFARSRFFSRFLHRPPIFPLPCVRLPSSFCPPSTSASFSPAASPSLHLSPALPSSLYIPPPPP